MNITFDELHIAECRIMYCRLVKKVLVLTCLQVVHLGCLHVVHLGCLHVVMVMLVLCRVGIASVVER